MIAGILTFLSGHPFFFSFYSSDWKWSIAHCLFLTGFLYQRSESTILSAGLYLLHYISYHCLFKCTLN